MRDSVDACLTRAFHDVPVPEGLGERLLAGLAVKRRRSRPWLWIGGSILTAAAGLLLAIVLGAPGQRCFSEQLALDTAIQAFDADVAQPGQSLAKRSAPSEYPLSQWVIRVREAS